MELKYIRIFVAFADKGFSGAAAELNMSKGLLSRYLSKVEEILGIELYLRSSGKMRLNEKGELFLKTSRKILALEEEYVNQLKRRQMQQEQIFSVGSIMQMSQYHIINVLMEYNKLYPDVVLDVHQKQGDGTLLEALRKEQIEIAFVGNGIADMGPEFDRLLYCIDRYCFVLPQNHPLAGRKSIRPEQLKDEKFILLPDRATVTRKFLHIAHEAGVEPKIIARFERGDNIQEIVESGYGISVLTRMPTEYHGEAHNVVLVDMEPNQTAPVFMVRYKRHKLSERATQFWRFVEERVLL